MRPQRLARLQAALEAEGVDAWLFYDFRGSDPVSYRVLELDENAATTRRWYCLVPRRGEPRGLVSAVEPHVLAGCPADVCVYRTFEEHRRGLRDLLASVARVAMQYSPENAVPYVSRVDAGTLELVRSFGVEVVSSADLVQEFEAVWTADQRASHERAATGLRQTVDRVFAKLAAARAVPSESDVQNWILEEFETRGLLTTKPPIVAVGAHSADPHYGPAPATAAPVGRGAFVLLDLWAKEPQGVYADITWTGQVSERVDGEYEEIFQIVRRARDAAYDFVRARVREHSTVAGYEVDAAARCVIEAAGYGDFFVHRTGHSIGAEVHGNGANIDGYETRDTRRLLPHTCFSIEPGIYLPNRFGVRSEIDVYVAEDDAVITGLPVQTAVVPILRATGRG